jgi:hypothetical protein
LASWQKASGMASFIFRVSANLVGDSKEEEAFALQIKRNPKG